jgi:hypothetical protein
MVSSEIIIEINNSCLSLFSLSLRSIHLSKSDFVLSEQILNQLTVLEIVECNIHVADLFEKCLPLYCHNLLVLKIDCLIFDLLDAEFLKTVIRNNPSIHTFHSSSIWSSSAALLTFIGENLSNLTSILMDKVDLIQAVMAFLDKFPQNQLTFVHFEMCGIQFRSQNITSTLRLKCNVTAPHLFFILSYFSDLKCLFFTTEDIDSLNLIKFITEYNPNLTELNLEIRNKLERECFSDILTMFPALKTLQINIRKDIKDVSTFVLISKQNAPFKITISTSYKEEFIAQIMRKYSNILQYEIGKGQ